MKIIIDIDENRYNLLKKQARTDLGREKMDEFAEAILNGTPLTLNVLADMLMEERIRGELKQDISYSKEVIDDVRCRLTVEIIDRRPCYCGAELKEVWRTEADRSEG